MLQVLEYARLTTDARATTSPTCGIVSSATFDWLQELAAGWKGTESVALVDGHRSLQLGSYVGYLQSPAGEAIEILPKTGFGMEQPQSSRRILQRMLETALDVKPRIGGAAELLRMRLPLHEWIFKQFLRELQLLIEKGMRFDYQRLDEESRFVRGRLRIDQQQRQAPGRQHLFHISHDIYSPDRLENRLLKTALAYILGTCKTGENWRLANELSHRTAEIPSDPDPLRGIRQWQTNKQMQIYDSVRPWCELILEKLNPNFQQGHHRGIALLFPMEQLFEKYVEVSLQQHLAPGFQLKRQARSEYMLRHTPFNSDIQTKMFQLKPDLMLVTPAGNQVLDAKWKRVNQSGWQSNEYYGIQQEDLYQLFAYGHKYQGGQGHMMLIYPKHQQFTDALPPFYFSDSLVIWAVPFCLETRRLIPGDWTKHFLQLSNQESKARTNQYPRDF